MLKPTSIDHAVKIYPTDADQAEGNTPYQVRMTLENGTDAMADFRVAFELPVGATHHDAVLLAETLKNINATVKLIST